MLIKFLSNYKRQIFILTLLGLVSSCFFLATPYLSKLFIDKAFLDKDFAKFLNLSIWGVGLFIVTTLVRIIQDVIKNKISIKLKLSLTNRFIRKFYSLDMAFFQAKSAGENVYRFFDAETITGLVLEHAPNLFTDIIKLPVILCISLWLSVPMTVFLLVLSPLFLVHSLYLQKKLQPIYEQMWKYSAQLSKEIYEAFSKILIIKAFGLEQYKRHSYLRTLINNVRWRIKSFRWAIISSLGSNFISKGVYGAITLYGGWLIIKGSLTLGSYAAAMLYLTQLGGLLASLSGRFEYLARDMVSVQRFFEIMDSRPEIIDSSDASQIESTTGHIRFENVWFGYQKETSILKGINLSIPAKSWIGIVGPSGCGKTTLVNLILRLYEPYKGEILLDGLSFKMIRLSSLREKIAIATQQPLLFDTTIKENITYGLKAISQARVDEAVRIACVGDFIAALPKVHDTIVGDDACRLSQGLKQRIAISRAIIRNPDILILDEATSSVDSFTEERIFKGLREKRIGLSTIIISHRLFSVKDADRIYFLSQDGIIEEGTHQGLLLESISYRTFFNNQLEIL